METTKQAIKYTFPLFFIFFISCSEQKKDVIKEELETIVPKIIYNKIHGFSEENYVFDSSVVQNGESFGEILQRMDISYSAINKLSTSFREVYDIRRIYPGDKYYILRTKDSLKSAKLIYQHSLTELVVMNFLDSIYLYVENKPITIKLKESAGVIKYSLWESFISNNLTPALVSDVANLYAWTIDFFDIQTNDSYKIIYEAKYVDDQFVGVGNIKAMLFNHKGRNLYAFRYGSPHEKIEHYYDEKGESMQRALLSAPLEYVRISSKFSHRRLHPIKKIYRPHFGVDYAAPTGTDVVSTGDGKVIFAGWSRGAGYMIKIKHTFGDVVTKYLHLNKFEKGIKKGVYVEQGEKIAEVGSTGLSTGPHLDYRVYIGGKPVNPLKMNIPSKDPIPDTLKEKYLKDILLLRKNLDQIEP